MRSWGIALTHYILTGEDGRTPAWVDITTPEGLDRWVSFYRSVLDSGQSLRRVGYTELKNDAVVSTVFLGLDHGDRRGLPMVFETRCKIGSEWVPDTHRFYATWSEAEVGHAAMVRKMTDLLDRTLDAMSDVRGLNMDGAVEGPVREGEPCER